MSFIQAKNIHRKRNNGDHIAHILKGVSLEISSGESVAITGKSGAGKSTLLHQLSGLDRPTEGELIVDGTSLNDLTEEEITKFRLDTFGFVFQDYSLVQDLPAVENVRLPLIMKGMDWDQATEIAKAALTRVGLENKFTNMPSSMSGGEQQRVSIARAVAGEPKILFADEPTANLDSVSGQSVIDLFRELHKQGQTIVMVTHEGDYARWCQRQVVLSDGVIITDEKTVW